MYFWAPRGCADGRCPQFKDVYMCVGGGGVPVLADAKDPLATRRSASSALCVAIEGLI